MARSSKLLGLGAMLALAGGTAQAENLDAGKPAPALFAANCAACHSSPRGLAKDRSSGGLTSYLEEHYTSSPQTAAALAAYLVANPGNPRAKQAPVVRNPAAPEEGSPKQGEAKSERQARTPRTETVRPDTMRPDSMIEPTEQKRSNAESAKTHGKRQQTKQEPPAAPAAGSAEPAAAAPAGAPAAAPATGTPPAQDQSAFSAPSP